MKNLLKTISTENFAGFVFHESMGNNDTNEAVNVPPVKTEKVVQTLTPEESEKQEVQKKKDIQFKLKALGFYDDKIDGVFSTETGKSVKKMKEVWNYREKNEADKLTEDDILRPKDLIVLDMMIKDQVIYLNKEAEKRYTERGHFSPTGEMEFVHSYYNDKEKGISSDFKKSAPNATYTQILNAAKEYEESNYGISERLNPNI